uniref:Uncharacterized protein n=1 Tax=Musca domestica TaxID=7370 RepID=A0A1I8MVY5_MUSDO
MAQYTQPVVGQQQQQQQSSPPQQHQQQQTQTTTPQAPNNTNNNNMNNNNNNNTNPAPTTPTAAAAPSVVAATTNNNNNQTQTIAVPQPVANAGNNNYATAQNVVPGVVGVAGAPVYNPQLQAANLYVPAAAHHGMPGHHHPQPGAMYSTMLPAPLSSNVFVNNVTANVNLHGWPHTAVPHGGWMHAAGAPHYIHGEIPPEQGGPVLQPMAMPIALQPTGQNMNTHSGGGGGGRGNRRGRGGRGGGSGSRRNDYNSQRHTPQQQQHHHHQQQQQHEGSPAPQGSSVQNTNQQSQEQQTIESQQIMSSIPYAPAHPHGPYAAAQYPYGYPAYFAPQQPMIHAGQNPAAQQAAGTSLFFSPMPVYNNPHIYNYGYFIPPVVNQAEYPYMPAEEVMAGQVVDERQGGGETSAMIWHQPHMYPGEEYAMNPNEMHSIGADDINQNSGSASETPTSMLSPNYTPIYDPQMHEMQQQMGVMQIYEDPQMGQMQVIHSQGGSAAAAAGGIGTQIEDDISECGSQRSAPIHIVPAGAIIASAPNMVAAPPALQQQHQPTNQISEQLPMHQQQPHLIPAAGSVISIDQTTSTNQQLPLSSACSIQRYNYPIWTLQSSLLLSVTLIHA